MDSLDEYTDEYVDDNIARIRMSICKRCPRFHPITNNCLECGCFMPIKTGLLHAECPLQKW